jgi:hypothetical protein
VCVYIFIDFLDDGGDLNKRVLLMNQKSIFNLLMKDWNFDLRVRGGYTGIPLLLICIKNTHINLEKYRGFKRRGTATGKFSIC